MRETTNTQASTYVYKPVQFFLVTYALTWIPWGIAAYLSYQPGMLVYRHAFFFLGGLGPTLGVLWVVLGSNSPELKRDFFDRLYNLRRIPLKYLVICFAFFPAAAVLSVFVSTFYGESFNQLTVTSDFLAWLPLLFAAPLSEEPGWRGYGVDSLRSKFGAFNATLIFSLLWVLWHWPLPFIKGTYQYDVAQTTHLVGVLNFFLGMIPLTFVFNWVYFRSNRSILAIILIHLSLNATPEMLSIAKLTKLLEFPIDCVIAALVVAFNWRLFAEGPKNFLTTEPEDPQRISGEGARVLR